MILLSFRLKEGGGPGLQRYVLAYAVGFLAAFAFPPFNAIPVLWVSFPVLIWLLSGGSCPPPRKGEGFKAFLTGWAFAFGLLTVSLYWIAGSLFVDIKTFWWVLPFAVAGLPAFLAIYYGLAAWAAVRFGLRGAPGVFFFALCWFGAEEARGHLLTGFPWDILGYAWGDCLPVLQITSVIGIEGLTLLTLFLAVLPSLFFTMRNKRKAFLFFVLGVTALAFLFAWGGARLADARVGSMPGVRLRLIQPDIDQALKWKSSQRIANLEKLLDLSFNAPGERPITHVIWPETATAYYLTEEPEVRSLIAARMPKDSVLITGVVRRSLAPAAGAEESFWRYYNSLIAMDSKGNVIAAYDKHHLVPFGEFMPLRSFVPFRVISMLGTDFTPGPGPRTVRAPGLPSFGALVCYEAIFPGAAVEKDDPPQFLLNVTNDAWYRGTIGPAQHFAISRVRAVENGLPLVRAANRGVTGVVDPYGRVIASVGERGAAFTDADLPQPIKAKTFFEIYGRCPLGLIALGLVFVLFSYRMKIVPYWRS